MRKNVLRLVLFAFAFMALFGVSLASQNPGTSVTSDLSALIQKINDKITAGKMTEEDLSTEVQEFERLIEKYKDSDSESAAEVMFWKGRLYFDVFQDEEAAFKIFSQLQKNYPSSDSAVDAEAFLTSLKLRAGAEFPDFQVNAVDGLPLSLSQYKNKVVLIDFWATWCPPCVQEMPGIVETYEKYHDRGFEIIGVSLDYNENKFRRFLESNGMTWRQYFDGQGGQNKLARKYAIESIPSTFLIDAQGNIIAKNLRGTALHAAIKNAVDNL